MKNIGKKTLVLFVKAAVIFSIFFFLFCQAYHNNAFSEFWNRPKHWGYLTLAFLANFIALSITLVRWYYLLRVLGVPFRFKNSLRIGYLSFLLNLAPVGIVTGDGFRLYILFRDFPELKAKCFAGVIVDRAIGLYVMLLVAVCAILASGFYAFQGTSGDMALIATTVKGMLILIAISTFFAMIVLLPDLKQGRGKRLLDCCCGRIPKLKSAILAIQTYRHHKRVLLMSGVMTIFVHVLFSFGIWLIALGFYGYAPTAIDHLVLHPVANVTQLIPLSLGPYEMVLDKLYTFFPIAGHETYKAGFGLIIALGYRFISLLLGGLGAVFYLTGRGATKHDSR